MSEIRFYAAGDEHGHLSNFASYPLEIRGKRWPTSEHYFQAQKFAGTEHEEAIRNVASPMVAARMGRSRSRPLRGDWETVKEEVMLEALRAKYTQHPELRDLLLATADARIIEHTSNDRYWADGGDGSGRNRLGVLLEQVRAELAAALEHVRAWRTVMNPGRTFACFLFGSCVVVTEDELAADAAARAQRILAEHGPVHPGSPSGDFGVHEMPDDFGWLVTGDHPDILVRVPPDAAGSELTVGLIGRSARDQDARALALVALERRELSASG